MFKRKVEDSGKTTVFRFACRIFYIHVMNVLITLVIYLLIDGLKLIGVEEPPESLYRISVTAVCFAVYLIYVYIHSWRIGQRDYNLVLYGHIAYNMWKPLAAAVISQIPGLILAIMTLIPPVSEVGRSFAGIFYFFFTWFIARLKDSFPAIYFIPALVPVILAPVAYHMGYRGIYLANKIVYNMPKEQENKNGGRR